MKRLFDFGQDLMERFQDSKRRKVAEVNYFERLPDELVVQIFEKVYEAKWLFMCYMVSPRFASLVVQCRTVSFKYPVPPNKKRLLDLSSMVEKFLKKFVSVQSLHVEFIYSGLQLAREYLFKWKATGYQKSSVVLVIRRRRDITSADNDDKPNVGATIQINPLQEELFYNKHKKVVSMLGKFIGCKYGMLAKIIQIGGFPNLKEAVITDYLNRGRLLIGEKADLDILRMSDPMTITAATVSKLWSQPVLKLPLSGFVAEEATLAIFKSSIDIDDVSIAQHAFQEEKELCEAAMELLKLKPIYDSQPALA